MKKKSVFLFKMGGYSNGGYDGDTDKNGNVGVKARGGGPGPSGGPVGWSGARIKMLLNVILISFAFQLLFTAFQSMANLQSSINKVGINATALKGVTAV